MVLVSVIRMIVQEVFSCARVEGYSHPSSSIRTMECSFMLSSLIHLELSFVPGDRYGSISILLHVDIQFDQHHLLKILFFPRMCFWLLWSKIGCPLVCGFMLWSSIQFCWSIHLFSDNTMLFLLPYNLKMRMAISPAVYYLGLF